MVGPLQLERDNLGSELTEDRAQLDTTVRNEGTASSLAIYAAVVWDNARTELQEVRGHLDRSSVWLVTGMQALVHTFDTLTDLHPGGNAYVVRKPGLSITL